MYRTSKAQDSHGKGARRRRLARQAVTALLCLAPAVVAAQDMGLTADIRAAAAASIQRHVAARDFALRMAEAGGDDPMSQWFRDAAAMHQRMIHEEQAGLTTTVSEEPSGTAQRDPKADAVSGPLQAYLAEQETLARDPKANAVSGPLQEYLARQAELAERAETGAPDQSPRWTTVVVDSTGEVIVNDRTDVVEAHGADMARRLTELEERRQAMESRVRAELVREINARTLEQPDGLDRAVHGKAAELASSRPATPGSDDVLKEIDALEDCGEALKQTLAERQAIADARSLCSEAAAAAQPNHHCTARFGPQLDAKDTQYKAIDGRCVELGEAINREIAIEHLKDFDLQSKLR